MKTEQSKQIGLGIVESLFDSFSNTLEGVSFIS